MHTFRTAYDAVFFQNLLRTTESVRISKILDEIVVITNKSVGGKEDTFSFDGTGFSASNRENYARFATKTEF